jgi:hypothetical protein
MTALSAAQLANIANGALDYYFGTPECYAQTIQNKPLLKALEGKKKTFPGGKGDISIALQGVFGAGGVADSLKGYTNNDTVTFMNPANIVRANWPWREMHIGMSISGTELKIDGLSVSDEMGIETSNHSQRDLTVLVNLLDNKLADMAEQSARSLNSLLWGDGLADPLAMQGIRALVTDDPTVGTVGGIDRATASNTWWRNHSDVAAPITSLPTMGGALIEHIQKTYRQLTRFGGRPTHAFCGSDFLAALERELRANGNYSMQGFSSGKDVSVGAINHMGLTFEYDPSLDDMGFSKRCYLLDLQNIFIQAMDGEWRRRHNPARPENAFVYYTSLTYTGQLVAKQLNSSAVLAIA